MSYWHAQCGVVKGFGYAHQIRTERGQSKLTISCCLRVDFSSTTTLCPPFFNKYAHVNPAIPPPVTTNLSAVGSGEIFITLDCFLMSEYEGRRMEGCRSSRIVATQQPDAKCLMWAIPYFPLINQWTNLYMASAGHFRLCSFEHCLEEASQGHQILLL